MIKHRKVIHFLNEIVDGAGNQIYYKIMYYAFLTLKSLDIERRHEHNSSWNRNELKWFWLL